MDFVNGTLHFVTQGGSAANTDGPTDDEDSDGRSHYSAHGSNASNTGQSSNFSQTYRERRREAHTQVRAVIIPWAAFVVETEKIYLMMYIF